MNPTQILLLCRVVSVVLEILVFDGLILARYIKASANHNTQTHLFQLTTSIDMDFWLSVFTFLTFIFVTSADSINPPGNITVLRIENRTPECPFNAEYREGQGPNSTFHISYNPSPYDTIRRLKVESLTCHSILELGYSIQNYTVAIRDAMFRAYVNLNYGEEARVEMSAVWWATTGLVSRQHSHLE